MGNPWDDVKDVVKPLAAVVNPVYGVQAYGEDIYRGAKQGYEDVSGKTAADAAKRASATQASAMMEQLDYLKEINRLPQQYKEQALTELAGLYGAEGSENQQVLIDRAKASPLYQQIMGGQAAGEEAVMRSAAQTGGLRSGNVQHAMYDYNTQLANQALTQTYGQQLSGLQGLAGLQTGEQKIGQTMADIGGVKAQGILGAAGAQQQGTQNLLNFGLGVAGLFV
jgi:hypothetical protein